MWRCGVCGYIYDGSEAPDKCPKCGSPKEKFAKVEDAGAQLIERSRRTNNLHAQLITLMGEVLCLAEKGIEDNLDPPCVDIFKKAKDAAWSLRQMSKAEIQGHVGKGKWG